MNLKSEARAHVQNYRFLLPHTQRAAIFSSVKHTALGLPVHGSTPRSSKQEGKVPPGPISVKQERL